MLNQWHWIVILLFISISQSVFADDFALIVNQKNIYSEDLSQMQKQIRKIFLKKNKKWPHTSHKVKVYCRGNHSEEQTSFNKVILKMSQSQLDRYWLKRKQRFGDSPPQEIKSAKIAMRLITRYPNAFTVVKKSELLHLKNSIKVLFMFSDNGRLYAYEKPKTVKKIIKKEIPKIIPKPVITSHKAVKIKLISPKRNFKTTAQDMTVKGRLIGKWRSRTLKINQNIVDINQNGLFEYSLPLAIGTTNIVIQVKDRKGKKIQLSRWVSRLPALDLKLDHDSVWVKNNQAAISGKIFGGLGETTLGINQKAIKTNKEGYFSAVISVKKMKKYIILSAQTATEKIEKKVRLKFEHKPIKLIINLPNSSETIKSSLLLSAKVMGGEGRLSVQINQQKIKLNQQDKFQHTLDIKMGKNKFIILVQDHYGNKRQKIINVLRHKPKALKIMLSQGNYLVSDKRRITIKGRIQGGIGERLLTIDSQLVSIDSNGRFYAVIEVKKGERKVILKARDENNVTVQEIIRVVGQ